MAVRVEKEDLEMKLQAAPCLEQKAQEGEEKAKATEEKYQKLKTMYTQIRDEHVKLLRQVREEEIRRYIYIPIGNLIKVAHYFNSITVGQSPY